MLASYRGQLPDQYLDDPSLVNRREGMWSRMLSTNPLNWTMAVAEDDQEQIVGFSSSGPTSDETIADKWLLELFTLYIIAYVHGRGVGQLSFDAVIKPEQKAVLWVADDNPKAQRFYKKNGFVADGEKKFEGISEIRMIRALVP